MKPIMEPDRMMRDADPSFISRPNYDLSASVEVSSYTRKRYWKAKTNFMQGIKIVESHRRLLDCRESTWHQRVNVAMITAEK